MEKGIKSKRRILEVAFKLFSAYSYPDVSYSLLEEATGISRGSMVYYFKNKEGIFRAVVDTFLVDINDTMEIPESERGSLRAAYNAFVDGIVKMRERTRPYKIKNINEACFNLTRNALQFIPEYREERRKAQEAEYGFWLRAIEASIEKGEVRADIDKESYATLFQCTRMGLFNLAVFQPKAYDPEHLRRLYDVLYSSIAAR